MVVTGEVFVFAAFLCGVDMLSIYPEHRRALDVDVLVSVDVL